MAYFPSYVDQPHNAQYTVEGGKRIPLFGSAYQAKLKAEADAAARAANPGAFPGAPKTPTDFTLSPKPTTGQGAFGNVPGQLGLPNPAGDLAKLYPGLTDQNAAISRNVAGELAGELSPETQAAIQDAAARFGVTSGMPGAGLVGHRTLRDLGLSTEALQQQGLKDYLASVSGIKQTQTVSPELQTEIASQNALNRAAPDPTQAASYAKQLFDQYLSRMRGPGGGTVNPGSFAPGVAGAGGGFKLPSLGTPTAPVVPGPQQGIGSLLTPRSYSEVQGPMIDAFDTNYLEGIDWNNVGPQELYA